MARWWILFVAGTALSIALSGCSMMAADPAPAPAAMVAQTQRPPALPDMAGRMVYDLDAQLSEKLQLADKTSKHLAMLVTTPVDLNNLDVTSPLSRLFAEELSNWFVRAGYKVQEIRKGKNILFDPQSGELLLTRRTDLLQEKNVRAALIVLGSYAATSRQVRFNIRVIHAASNEVLAMSSQTLPATGELREMLADDYVPSVEPDIHTTIRPRAESPALAPPERLY